MSPVRIGVFSDVHGNLPALRSVLGALDGLGVDVLVCAGDLVGYGPFPDECVQLLVDRGVRTVAGNHDLMVAGLLPGGRCSPLAARSLRWTRSVVTDRTVDHLTALPARVEVGPVVVTHGALGDPQRYTATTDHATEQLESLAREHPAASGLVLGHTHRQWVYRDGAGTTRTGPVRLGGARFLLNPGSVGQSRQWEPTPRARFAVLDLDSRTAHMHAVRYDVAACVAALDRIGMPRAALHSRPGARAVWRRARRTLRWSNRS